MEASKKPKYHDHFYREFMWCVFKEINLYMKSEYIYKSNQTAFFIAGLLKANQECFQNHERIYKFLSEHEFIVSPDKIDDKKDQLLIVDPKKPFFPTYYLHLGSFARIRSTLTDEERILIRDITVYFLKSMGEREEVLKDPGISQLESFTDDLRQRFRAIYSDDKTDYVITISKRSPIEISKEFADNHSLIYNEPLFAKIFKNSKDDDLALEF